MGVLGVMWHVKILANKYQYLKNDTYKIYTALTMELPSVLWCCCLGNRKGIRPAKKYGVMRCWRGYLSGANDLHMVQLMPLPPHHLLQNPEWFILLVPAYPGVLEKKAVKRWCVCVLQWNTNKKSYMAYKVAPCYLEWAWRSLTVCRAFQMQFIDHNHGILQISNDTERRVVPLW